MKDKNGLTIKQTAFAKAYALDSNAGRAYLAAGYKATGNERIHGYKLLQDSRILTIIEQEKAKMAIKSDITAENITHAVADIAFDDIKTETGYQFNVNTSNRLKALELLSRINGMLKDNVNITDTQRQRELDAQESEEAAELARLRLAQKYGLRTAENCQTAAAGEARKAESG